MMPKNSGGLDARQVAEDRFAKVTQAEKKARKEREKAKLQEEAHTARLRALRLAKEAADREAAAQAGPIKVRKSVRKA